MVEVPFTVDTHWQDESAAVLARGDLDADASLVLVLAVRDALAARPAELSVDLSAVTRLDQAGVHALVMIRQGAESFAADFRVVVTPTQAVTLGQVVGLHGVLESRHD